LMCWIGRWWCKLDACLGVWHCGHGQGVGNGLIINDYCESVRLASRSAAVKCVGEADKRGRC
jgi:hypothetical protein